MSLTVGAVQYGDIGEAPCGRHGLSLKHINAADHFIDLFCHENCLGKRAIRFQQAYFSTGFPACFQGHISFGFIQKKLLGAEYDFGGRTVVPGKLYLSGMGEILKEFLKTAGI
ncbi:hypothetical protein SDC9_172898 [bioreactor metagenome]|uniref:Uncharacterized protein n=1 Tax=bioreactor metagenome TaxID=1076179 RepID=A0A645GF09_9ZZZZ